MFEKKRVYKFTQSVVFLQVKYQREFFFLA